MDWRDVGAIVAELERSQSDRRSTGAADDRRFVAQAVDDVFAEIRGEEV